MSPRRRGGTRVVVASTVGALLALAVVVGSLSAGPTRGRIPDEAFGTDGSVNHELVPDFIPAVGTVSEEPIGWVAKDDVLPEDPNLLREVVPVYADDLQTVIGHMYPAIGFVPIGTDPASVHPVSTPEVFEAPAPDQTD